MSLFYKNFPHFSHVILITTVYYIKRICYKSLKHESLDQFSVSLSFNMPFLELPDKMDIYKMREELCHMWKVKDLQNQENIWLLLSNSLRYQRGAELGSMDRKNRKAVVNPK